MIDHVTHQKARVLHRHGRVATSVLFLLAAAAGGVRAQPAGSTPPSGDEARRSEREERYIKEQNERTRRLMQAFADLAQETSDVLERLEKRIAEFGPRLDSLLTSDQGKRLAQDQASSEVYQALRNEPVVSLDQIRSKKQAVNSILAGLKEELKREAVGYLPDASVQREVNETFDWAKDNLGAAIERANVLDGVLAKLPRDSDVANLKTLQEVIRDYEAQRAETWAIARTKAVESAREENQKRLTESARNAELERGKLEVEQLLKEARAQNEKLQAEFEIKLKAQEAEENRRLAEAQKKHDDEIAAVRRDLEEAKAERLKKDAEGKVNTDKKIAEAHDVELRHKCHDPKVMALLAPFTTPGYYQPRPNGAVIEIELVPMSLSRLRSFGALEPTNHGIFQLLEVGTFKGDKARPRWPYMKRIEMLSPHDLEQVKLTQKYLIELGDALVEEKMLSE